MPAKGGAVGELHRRAKSAVEEQRPTAGSVTGDRDVQSIIHGDSDEDDLMMDELIWIKSQIERAEFLPIDLRSLIILPDNQWNTWLIVQHFHERSGYRYRQAVKNEFRQLYRTCSGPEGVGFLRMVQGSSLSP